MLCTTAINTSNTITRGRPGLVNTDCAAEITDGNKNGLQPEVDGKPIGECIRPVKHVRTHTQTDNSKT